MHSAGLKCFVIKKKSQHEKQVSFFHALQSLYFILPGNYYFDETDKL
jgi:hypothetical protein